MFKETIKDIDHEIEWIEYELSRQSTNSDQEKSLKAKRKALQVIRSLCSDYNEGKIDTELNTGASMTHKEVIRSHSKV